MEIQGTAVSATTLHALFDLDTDLKTVDGVNALPSWLSLCEGAEDKGPTWKPILSLNNMVRKLFPEVEADSLLAEHHEAGADANMARLVYLTLVTRVKAATADL